MELTKENIYDEIQKYIYANKFSDLKVFSKQYFHSITLPCYSDNSKTEPYSIISIDFNDMQKINEKGIKKGDKILHDSIDLMQSTLPENSYCIRIGGDEFLFFLPNIPKEKALEYEQKIHENLNASSKKIRGTTITSYTVCSKDANDLSTLVDIADSGISTIKQTAKSSKFIDDWDILENKVRENFSTFFKTLRFHNFPMKTTHLKNILLNVINSYDTFVAEENNSVVENPREATHSESMHKKYYLDNLQDLNNLFINNRNKFPTNEELDKFEISTLANVLNYLVRDPLTMQFNKSYLVNHLLKDKKQDFKALRISSTFVKLSNTINFSHSSTDKQIVGTTDDIYKFLNNKIYFNQDAFSDLPINYMVALDGGDMLLALNPETDLNVEDIKDFLNVKNSEQYTSDNLLRLVVSDKFEHLNRRNLEKVLSKQDEQCHKNKIPLINELLSEDIASDLLDITLKDTMLFYKELISDKKDILAKTKYVDLVSRTILDLYSTLDVVHEDVKHQSRISKFASKISSIFKKKQLALPTPTELENNKETTDDKKVVPFVPKVEIDYSKIRYIDDKRPKQDRDLGSK